MPRSLRRIPDYFTEEEAGALVNAAPSYPARMAFRIMLKTGLRVSEALALRRVDLRLDQHPPIIVVRADSPGNKARKGREVPVPADLVESLRDLASSHSKDHYQPMLNLSRQRIGQVMKDAAREVGIDPARAHPHAFRHTYGRNCVLRGVPIPVLQKWLGHSSLTDTQRFVELAGAHHEWVSRCEHRRAYLLGAGAKLRIRRSGRRAKIARLLGVRGRDNVRLSENRFV